MVTEGSSCYPPSTERSPGLSPGAGLLNPEGGIPKALSESRKSADQTVGTTDQVLAAEAIQLTLPQSTTGCPRDVAQLGLQAMEVESQPNVQNEPLRKGLRPWQARVLPLARLKERKAQNKEAEASAKNAPIEITMEATRNNLDESEKSYIRSLENARGGQSK